MLQVADWLGDPEQDPSPVQDLDLVFVPLPQLLLHDPRILNYPDDPYGLQEPQDAMKRPHVVVTLLFFVYIPCKKVESFDTTYKVPVHSNDDPFYV